MIEGIPEFLKRRKLTAKEEKEYIEKIRTARRVEVAESSIRPIAFHTDKAAPQAYVKERVSSLISDLEAEVDTFISNGYKSDFSPYDWIRLQELKAIHALRISQYYTPLLEEIQASKTDPEVREGYQHLTKAQLTNYEKFIQDIVDSAATWNSNVKRARKPRKRKVRKADQIVAKVKYCKEFAPLKLVSMAPERVLKAQELWVYDTRYKYLTVYYAANSDGLSIRGTTIKNYDPAASYKKRVRKPAEVIPMLTGKRAMMAAMGKLKTKQKKPRGRINENVVLLKSFT